MKKTAPKPQAQASITPEAVRDLIRAELAAVAAEAKPKPKTARAALAIERKTERASAPKPKTAAATKPAAKGAEKRRRGRPSIAENSGAAHEPSRMFSIRLPLSEHQKIRRLLEKQGITATEWVRGLIRKGADLA